MKIFNLNILNLDIDKILNFTEKHGRRGFESQSRFGFVLQRTEMGKDWR